MGPCWEPPIDPGPRNRYPWPAAMPRTAMAGGRRSCRDLYVVSALTGRTDTGPPTARPSWPNPSLQAPSAPPPTAAAPAAAPAALSSRRRVTAGCGSCSATGGRGSNCLRGPQNPARDDARGAAPAGEGGGGLPPHRRRDRRPGAWAAGPDESVGPVTRVTTNESTVEHHL